MTSTKIKTHPGNNGNLNDLFHKKFGIRIKVDNEKLYNEILDYLEKEALRGGLYGSLLEGNRYYVFDEKGEQVVRTRRLQKIIELTEASENIKKEVYSKLEIE